jgi:ribonuclease J
MKAGGHLQIIPLGGVGEIGKNMTAVELGHDLIVIDSGGKLPEGDQRGCDLVIPDVHYLRERLPDLRAILITHGHEDHIGSLPYIIPQLKRRTPIPIFGSPLAIGLVERKLAEHRLKKYATLHTVEPGQQVHFGPLAAEFIHVAHSIADANAIAIHSPVGTIIDTGDFKFDPTPVMGEPTDVVRLRQLGDRGVLALLSDTTRVEASGRTPSERVVMETIDQVVGDARGQVLIATFASNVSRIHMAVQAARKHVRKVAVAGRAMEQNAAVALELGYLDQAEGILLPLDEILTLPKDQRVLVITGSQGEPTAALTRIAAGDHAKIRIGEGDVVLVSATPIPGNEEPVSQTIDNLFRLGARVIYSSLARGVHVSGHASRDDLRHMLQLVRPRFAVPIHGEYRHLVLYRDLCLEVGIPAERVLLPEIGDVLEFTRERAKHRGRVSAGSILVERVGDRRAGRAVFRDREHIFAGGVVFVMVAVDAESGKLIAGPHLVANDVDADLQHGALPEVEQELRRALERQKGPPQHAYLVQRAREIVARSLSRHAKIRPLIYPVVTEL